MLLAGQLSAAAMVGAGISPSSVEATLFPGDSVVIQKAVTTPALPPIVDVCLLQDETGSFADDIVNLNTAAPGIYDAIVAASPGAQFAVAGFRDYPVNPYGSAGDWVYRLISSMNPAKSAWTAGVAGLSASGGADTPEAQYDAIVAAVGSGLGTQPNCGWRAPSTGAQRVLLVSTDAPFHGPDGTHVNSSASTIAALIAADVIVIGLKAPGAGSELDAIVAGAGGSVQPLSSNSSNISAAILAGLAAVEVDVMMESTCAWPITTTFAPSSVTVVSGGVANFTEAISVAANAPGGTYTCRDVARINGDLLKDDAGLVISEVKTIKVPEGFLTGGGQIIEGSGKSAAKISFAGNVGFLADFSLVGQYQINFHNVKGTALDGGKFHSTAITSLQFDVVCGPDAYPPPANANRGVFTATGRFNGEDGWTVEVRAADFGEPGKDNDSIRIILTNPGGTFVYDSNKDLGGDFPDNDNKPGCATDDSIRHLLDAGNLQIHSGLKN
jgi:hypothetical protein